MDKTRVLFVCAHNSARSQIAEAFLKEMAGDRYDPQSAGLEPGPLNPLAVEAMREIGIDISRNQTKSAFDFFKRGELFSYVITVCDEKTAEACPVFPGVTNRWHWSFEDPAALTGSHEEKMVKMRKIRDQIRDKIEAFLAMPESSNESLKIQL